MLDLECARRGVDVQGFRGVTRAGATVGYSTTYSDQSNELTNPAYGNAGSGLLKAGSDGSFRATWVVPAIAPAGVATIRLIVSPKGSPITPQVTYRVSEGACS